MDKNAVVIGKKFQVCAKAQVISETN